MTEISSRDKFAQLGHDLGVSYRLKRFMIEAVRGVIEFLFLDIGVHRIYGQCRALNIASARVMQKQECFMKAGKESITLRVMVHIVMWIYMV